MTAHSPVRRELPGLDLARYLVFVGMVLVNFKIAMGAEEEGTLISFLISSIEGRAAATFVVLAGIGLGLMRIKSYGHTLYTVGKRATLLLLLGFLNVLIFEADIIHYYAFYFFIAAFFLPLSNRWLGAALIGVNLVFLVLVFLLDYDLGWNWDTYVYTDFWTFDGFIRNLFFNGWHPVFPWIGFLFFGVMLSRLPLHTRPTQNHLIWGGLTLLIAVEGISLLLTPVFQTIDRELALMVTTKPIPPLPLYTLAGLGFGAFLIGLCLRTADWVQNIGILPLIAPAGRQTLTLYFAHILIGMGTLEALDMLGGQTAGQSAGAALIFCASATAFSYLWSKKFKHGPTESLLKAIGR